MSRRAIAAALVFGLSLMPAHARADGDKAAAEALFSEAKRLMSERRYDEACPKLAESQRLDAGGGTLLNLALCHEKQGKTATAWSEFKEALAVARRDRREDRITFAKQHIEQLQPLLSQLRIDVGEKAVDGLIVAVDGSELGRPSWGVPLPIDPGEHRVVASAPGRVSFETTVSIAASADQQSVSVPVLEVDPNVQASPSEPSPIAPSPKPTSKPTPAADSSPNLQRIAGYSIGGLGLLGLAIGAGFGVRAINQDGEADELCPEQEQCPATPDGERAVELSGNAQTSANLANGFVGAGAALVAAGLIVVLTAGDESDDGDANSARLVPLLGPDRAGLDFHMKW